MPNTEPATFDATHDTAFFGHPRGLSTLFFTEMWERFSYYGMRALLVLFMTASATGNNPGLGFDVGSSGAIYGLYTSLVYLVALPGGWIADKLWGQRKAVFVGGCVIAAGHFAMAVPVLPMFYLGLTLIVIGTGLLKPNVSAMVGDLYPEGGARRDAGFSVYYMGINLGAFFGPVVCGYFGEGYSYHLGFSFAGIGMVAGLIQYKLGAKNLGQAGDLKPDTDAAGLAARGKSTAMIFGATVAAVALLAYLMSSGAIGLTVVGLAESLGYGILLLCGAFFLYLFVAGGLSAIEKKRLAVIVWLFLLVAVFWSGFEQAGSSMNLFTRDLTNRVLFGFEMPASWFQTINAFFIVAMAPLFGSVWTWLAKRNANPSIPVKFALGLFGLAAGFFVLAWGAANASPTNRVSMSWLIVTLLLPHRRRALPVARGPLLHDQARTKWPRQPNDGRLVRCGVPWQSLRGSASR